MVSESGDHKRIYIFDMVNYVIFEANNGKHLVVLVCKFTL